MTSRGGNLSAAILRQCWRKLIIKILNQLVRFPLCLAGLLLAPNGAITARRRCRGQRPVTHLHRPGIFVIFLRIFSQKSWGFPPQSAGPPPPVSLPFFRPKIGEDFP